MTKFLETTQMKSRSNKTVELLEVYKIAVATRQFELTQFWSRCNYFLVMNTGLLAGFFTIPDERVRAGAALMGLVVSMLWFQVALGSKFWQVRWESAVEHIEEQMVGNRMLSSGERMFSQPQSKVFEDVRDHQAASAVGVLGKIFHRLVLEKPSVTQAMMLLVVACIVMWLGLFVYQIHAVARLLSA